MQQLRRSAFAASSTRPGLDRTTHEAGLRPDYARESCSTPKEPTPKRSRTPLAETTTSCHQCMEESLVQCTPSAGHTPAPLPPELDTNRRRTS